MIDHVTIYVQNLEESKVFYERAFEPFGWKITFGENDVFWAFDIGNGAHFEIAQYWCGPEKVDGRFRESRSCLKFIGAFET